jgi:hypothetical protein
MTAKLIVKENVAEPSEQAVNTPLVHKDGRPDAEWVRGKCPVCGDDLVSNLYYIGGQGYLVRWECWSSLGEEPSCEYRRVL